MILENPEQPRNGFSPKRAVSIAGIVIVSAAASVACYRTGYFIFFFLLPLSFSAFLGEALTAWAAGILAVALNVLVSLWFYMYQDAAPFLLQWNTLYYAVMVLAFTWINVPLGRFWMVREIPYRMVAGAFVSAFLLMPFLLSMTHNDEIRFHLIRQIETLGNYSSSSGFSDATVEELLSQIVYMGMRGGILLSCLVFWWINRQVALLVSRLIRREQINQAGLLLSFRTPFSLVWILSFSFGAVLLGKIGKIELLEIGGWNILVLSATLFLVQGGAVALYYLARLPPVLRIIVNVVIVILFFRPGIYAVVLIALVFLGIAENWVPFRAPKN